MRSMARSARMPLLVATTIAILMLAAEAHADPDVSGEVSGDTVFLAAVEQTQEDSRGDSFVPAASGASPFVEYRWEIVCTRPLVQSNSEIMNDCMAARVCARPRERLYRLWGRTAADDTWIPLSARCFGDGPPDAPEPEITPGLVLNEIRRIGLPTLQARTQPEGKTLVNFDTIFYTHAQPFSATVILLGQQVEVTAEAVRFTWHHGDGTSETTASPGAPYPSKEITYRYSDAGTAVHPRVDVTYAARFRVNGGTWQDIDETLTITGPEGDLAVAEAAPALSGDYS